MNSNWRKFQLLFLSLSLFLSHTSFALNNTLNTAPIELATETDSEIINGLQNDIDELELELTNMEKHLKSERLNHGGITLGALLVMVPTWYWTSDRLFEMCKILRNSPSCLAKGNKWIPSQTEVKTNFTANKSIMVRHIAYAGIFYVISSYVAYPIARKHGEAAILGEGDIEKLFTEINITKQKLIIQKKLLAQTMNQTIPDSLMKEEIELMQKMQQKSELKVEERLFVELDQLESYVYGLENQVILKRVLSGGVAMGAFLLSFAPFVITGPSMIKFVELIKDVSTPERRAKYYKEGNYSARLKLTGLAAFNIFNLSLFLIIEGALTGVANRYAKIAIVGDDEIKSTKKNIKELKDKIKVQKEILKSTMTAPL